MAEMGLGKQAGWPVTKLAGRPNSQAPGALTKRQRRIWVLLHDWQAAAAGRDGALPDILVLARLPRDAEVSNEGVFELRGVWRRERDCRWHCHREAAQLDACPTKQARQLCPCRACCPRQVAGHLLARLTAGVSIAKPSPGDPAPTCFVCVSTSRPSAGPAGLEWVCRMPSGLLLAGMLSAPIRRAMSAAHACIPPACTSRARVALSPTSVQRGA